MNELTYEKKRLYLWCLLITDVIKSDLEHQNQTENYRMKRFKSNFGDFFKIQNFKDCLIAVLRKRRGNQRLILVMLIMAFVLEMLCDQGFELFFLYLRKVLDFQMWDFTRLMTLAGLIGLTGQYIFVPLFSRYLKLHDATISLIGKQYFKNSGP